MDKIANRLIKKTVEKIIFFIESLGAGGAERQLTDLAISLHDNGNHVFVITYVKKDFYLPLLKKNGIKCLCISKALNRYTRIFYFRHILKKIEPDIVISFLSSTNISLCLTSFLIKINLIVSERSYTTKFALRTMLQFLLYNRASFVVTNSFAEAENIKKHCNWLTNKLKTIPNYVNTSLFSPLNVERENSISPLMLVVGRLYYVKNIKRIILAVKEVLDYGYKFEVNVVGDLAYDKAYVADIMRIVKDLKLDKIIQFQGIKTNMPSEYHRADFFCMASEFEGYPNALCEAMSCALPVICSDACEMPRIVSNEINGFIFNPFDVKSIANAIIKMLCLTPAERKKMGGYNREKIIHNNSKDAFLESYVSLINKLSSANN